LTDYSIYNRSKNIVPYINVIIENSRLDKDAFETEFSDKYRNRSRVIEQYWHGIIQNELLPLKEELS